MIGGNRLPDPAMARCVPTRKRLAAPGGDAARPPPGRLLIVLTAFAPNTKHLSPHTTFLAVTGDRTRRRRGVSRRAKGWSLPREMRHTLPRAAFLHTWAGNWTHVTPGGLSRMPSCAAEEGNPTGVISN